MVQRVALVIVAVLCTISPWAVVVDAACPCSIWASSVTPTFTDSDISSVELGVRFRADADGTITAIRFFKSTPNTGTHTGALWSATGTLLGGVTFAAETASGWQQGNFAQPIPITANVTYVASYHAPAGRYMSTMSYFATANTDAPPLHALLSTASAPNGVYVYAASRAFPTQTFNATNYWVDVVYMPKPTGIPVTAQSQLAWNVPTTGGTPTGYRLNASGTIYDLGKPAETTCPDSPNPCYLISLSFLAPGTYTIALIAYNAESESPPSDAIQITVEAAPTSPTPSKPSGVRIIG